MCFQNKHISMNFQRASEQTYQLTQVQKVEMAGCDTDPVSHKKGIALTSGCYFLISYLFQNVIFFQQVSRVDLHISEKYHQASE